MKIIINNIKLSLGDDITILKEKIARKLKLNINDFTDFRIIKESLDARRKNNIFFVYSLMVEVEKRIIIPGDDKDIKELIYQKDENIIPGEKVLKERPVIVGSGPAGLFSALFLARNGYRPLIIERGDNVETRVEKVKKYWEEGILDIESNVQFGEGGAGTFSDGKLTTRINDFRCEKVLEEFHKTGVSKEILYKSKPHIGTDKLRNVIINLRKKIIEYGGEFRFKTKLTSLKINNGKITGIITDNKESINTNAVVLAIGHSARDTFDTLLSDGVTLVQKPFSMGVRIEHLQEMIDKSQYGKVAGHPRLSAGDYHLFYKAGQRTVYTFCMCPGGLVVASSSEKNAIVTNGMSEFARDKKNANSAFVVSVPTNDFGSSYPLAGIELQRNLEREAFKIGGSDNSAPLQRLGDFLNSKNSGKLGIVKPSYTGKTKITDLNLCLPDFIKLPMKESVKYFDNKLNGFGIYDAVLTGVETRTSSPVRIERNDSLQAIGIESLYPAGGGAGYTGGIVSAAVDGIRIAEQIIKTFKVPV